MTDLVQRSPENSRQTTDVSEAQKELTFDLMCKQNVLPREVCQRQEEQQLQSGALNLAKDLYSGKAEQGRTLTDFQTLVKDKDSKVVADVLNGAFRNRIFTGGILPREELFRAEAKTDQVLILKERNSFVNPDPKPFAVLNTRK